MTLQQMAEIAEKATSGEWSVSNASPGPNEMGLRTVMVLGGEGQDFGLLADVTLACDAAHIAACSPANIIAAAAEERRLVARVAELEAENARLRQSHIWRVGDYVTPHGTSLESWRREFAAQPRADHCGDCPIHQPKDQPK